MADPSGPDQQSTPTWPTCTHKTARGERCIGYRVMGWERWGRCFAHLDRRLQRRIIAQLGPAANLDLRGNEISTDLLKFIQDAVRNEKQVPVFGALHLELAQFTGSASFENAHFTEGVWFTGARFDGPVSFRGARFEGLTRFDEVSFRDSATFYDARFLGMSRFDNARFHEKVDFQGALFEDGAQFDAARFDDDVYFGVTAGLPPPRAHFKCYTSFRGAHFERDARFDSVGFEDGACFDDAFFGGNSQFYNAYFAKYGQLVGARFETAELFGPVGADSLDLHGATFVKRVRIELAAVDFFGSGVRFESGATLHLGYARTHLGHAVFGGPSTIMPVEAPVIVDPTAKSNVAAGSGRAPMLVSLEGVDATDLVVIDIDMSRCQFAGAHHLDKMRIEGRCLFSAPPVGMRFGRTWPPAWRWARRQVLAEERRWRAGTHKAAGWVEPDSREQAATELYLSDSQRGTLQHLIAEADIGESQRRNLQAIVAKTDIGERERDMLLDIVTKADIGNADRSALMKSISTVNLNYRDRFNLRKLVVDADINRSQRDDLRRALAAPQISESQRGTLVDIVAASDLDDSQSIDLMYAVHDESSLQPERLAIAYRQLRKALEDSKNEPGAADFYYGEMEMRRKAVSTGLPERIILFLYWTASGYGLRAIRALTWLAIFVAIIGLGLYAVGFPEAHPDLVSCLIYAAASTVSLDTKLAGVPKDLAWPGEIMRITIRLAGPLLLGLALLAIRNRIKR